MPRYVPGARGDVGGPEPIKLSSNEMPFGPLESVREVIAGASAGVNRYPDMFSVDLTERIAVRLGLEPAQVVVGGGSVAVLGHILQAYCGIGDEVMFAWRSFEAYPILTQLTGASPIMIPLTGEAEHDLPSMAAAISDRTKVVMVCSPNNPTGPVISAEAFEEFMQQVPSTVLVVLDEAYGEFVRDPYVVNGLDALTRYPNLVLLRTFSKAYGLAGLRVGYAAGPEDVIAHVRTCVTPFSVNSLAQTAAIASLDAEQELLERVEQVVAERIRVHEALTAQGWTVPASEGNFVWIAARENTDAVVEAATAAERPLLVRPFAGEGVRITIGTPEENDAMLAALDGLHFRA